jgi:hypothetical protein
MVVSQIIIVVCVEGRRIPGNCIQLECTKMSSNLLIQSTLNVKKDERSDVVVI